MTEIKQAHVIEKTDEIEPQLLIKDPPDFVSFRYPLRSEVKAQLTDDSVLVTGKIKTILQLECARCLEKMERPYEVGFQQIFSLDLKEVDISEDIRESVLIDLPFKSLCKENCLGLCPLCGKNKNVAACACKPELDSRWNVLKQYPFK